jgi:hypothetical protein
MELTKSIPKAASSRASSSRPSSPEESLRKTNLTRPNRTNDAIQDPKVPETAHIGKGFRYADTRVDGKGYPLRWVRARAYSAGHDIPVQTLANWRYKDRRAGRVEALPGHPYYKYFGNTVRYLDD